MVEVKDYLQDVAQIVRRCPTQTLVRAYVRAARKLCIESRWYRVTIVGQTVEGQQQYSLGSDPFLDIIGIRAMGGTQGTRKWPIVPSDPTQWSAVAQPGDPRRYAYIPQAQFAVNPTPNSVIDLQVTAVCAPKEGATQLPDEIMRWSEGFQDGALAYLLNIPGQPWSNAVLGQNYGQAWRAAIANAKADEQRAYNQGTVVARRRRIF